MRTDDAPQAPMPTPEEARAFFERYPEANAIFEAVWEAARELGPVALRVTKSQVALVRVRPFAWAWVPAMYLRGQRLAPLALSFSFREPRPWPRWKEIYPAGNRRYTHHLELWSAEEVDEETRDWLRAAWESAGPQPA